MQAKTNLNNTQRKILEGIYVDRLRTRKEAALEAKCGKKAAFEARVKANVLKDPKVKEVNKAIDTAAKLIKKYEGHFEDLGLRVSDGYGNSRLDETRIRFVSNRYSEKKNPDLLKFDQEVDELRDKYDEAIHTARLKIWGLNVTYAEIEKELDELLESL